MSIVHFSPLDARNERLKRTVWGYDRRQVDRLLDQLVWSYDQAWREHDELRERVATLEHELASFRESDGFLRKALVTAERVAAEVRARAEDEATSLVETAEVQARELIGKGQSRWEELQARAESDARSLVESASTRAQEIVSEAEKLREELKANTAEDANKLREAARAEADEILDGAQKGREQIGTEIERLAALKEEMENGLRAFVLAALELLDRETKRDSEDGRPSSTDPATSVAQV